MGRLTGMWGLLVLRPGQLARLTDGLLHMLWHLVGLGWKLLSRLWHLASLRWKLLY